MSLVIVSSVNAGRAQAGQDIEWLDQFGSVGFDQAADVVADPTGAYVVGSVGDGSPFGTTGYVRRYGLDGALAWTQSLGAGFSDAFGVASYDGAVYITGRPRGFLQRRDAAGTLLWTRQISCCDAYGFDVAADATGVYVSGRIGAGALPGQTSAGFIDAYLQRYDHVGNLMWSRQFGTPGQDEAQGVSLSDGAVFVSGLTGGSLPGATSSGGFDGFVMRLDLEGNRVWTRHVGTADFDDAGRVAADTTGIYVVGRTGGALPGQTFVGEHDAYIRKLDPSGAEMWTRQFGTTYPDALGSVTTDATGIYVGGWTYGPLVLPVSERINAALARKYDHAGNVVWTYQFPRASFTHGVASDSTGVYVVGSAESALPGQTFLGFRDAFVSRLISFPNRAPVAVAGDDQIVGEGTTVALDGSRSTDPDSDLMTYEWTLLSSSGADIVLENASAAVASFAAIDEGVYNFRLTITDTSRASASDDVSVEVVNANPAVIILAPAPGAVYSVGALVTLEGTFGDSGALDTHTATWNLTAADATADVAGIVTEADGSGSVAGGHVFAAPGIYQVSLAVTDNDGGSTSTSTTVDGTDAFVVVFDPTAGHVTGGGWLDVPAGAYQADPSVEGRATFGFVARYERHADVPTGTTQFRFAVAGLEFLSRDYEWLVIAGARAKFKGNGTINSSGIFGFTLSAVDGDHPRGDGIDRFRLKIWDRDSGGLIFDNDVATSGEEATTAIGAGSIVIHK
jgi:hypothetical protein